MTALASTLLAVAMLAAFALLIGAAAIWRKQHDAKRAALMVVAALVLVANVLIWTI